VSFGYDGGYRAAAHGLEPVTLRDGDISQDPDQTYPSADDGEGVDRIPLALSGAAFLRLELEIPGPDDIDLFLEDSSGTIVAQSTAAGTNELIELTFPADDDYTLVVHGWAVPSEPLSYAISQWVVSATPGGSLSIDSAPTAAATGATGTIDISWSGLDAGVPYLGAVSHSDDTGALGLTLIDVQT
jgi:hypothetical protein